MLPSRPKFAVLGWGSLLWDMRPEFEGFNSRLGAWDPAGPTLRLEFARVSSTRSGALTLVLVEEPDGGACEVSFAVINRARLEDAVCDVRCREGCNLADIGYCCVGTSDARGRNSAVVAAIRAWGATKKLDAVVWTDLSANFADKSNPKAPFSVPAALAHLQNCSAEGKSLAAEYVWRAPDFVKTPLRTVLQAAPWFAMPPPAATATEARSGKAP